MPDESSCGGHAECSLPSGHDGPHFIPGRVALPAPDRCDSMSAPDEFQCNLVAGHGGLHRYGRGVVWRNADPVVRSICSRDCAEGGRCLNPECPRERALRQLAPGRYEAGDF